MVGQIGRRVRVGIVALVLGAGVCWSDTAHAWGGFGHMVVAASAFEQLTPSVKTNVQQLLKLNARYMAWVKDVAAKDRAKVALVMSMTWPDCIKLAKDVAYLDLDPPIGMGASPYETNAAYRKKGREVAAERMRLAGASLANHPGELRRLMPGTSRRGEV